MQAGNVEVSVSANLAPLRQGLAQAEREAKGFSTRVGQSMKDVGAAVHKGFGDVVPTLKNMDQTLNLIAIHGQHTASVLDRISTSMGQIRQGGGGGGGRGGGGGSSGGNPFYTVQQGTKAFNADLTNLRFQINDVATSLASGSSPFVVLSQQAGQFSQVLERSNRPAAMLGQAVLSMVNPVNLAILGFAGLVYGIQSLFSSVEEGVSKTQSVLEAHSASIRDIKDAWGEAAKGLDDYLKKSPEVAESNRLASGKDLGKQIRAELEQTIGEIDTFLAYVGNSVDAVLPDREQLNEVVAALETLRGQFKEGLIPDVIEFQNVLGRVQINKQTSEELFDAVQLLKEATEQAYELDRALGGNIKAGTKVTYPLAEPRNPPRGTNLRIPSNLVPRPKDGGDPRKDLTTYDAEAERAAEEAARALEREREARERLLFGMDARVERLQIERDALDMTEAAAAAYRMEKETILQAQQQGISLSDEELSRLHDAAQAYGQLQAEINEMKKAQQDAERQAEQMADVFSDLFVGIAKGGDSARQAIIRLVAELLKGALLGEGAFGKLFKGGLVAKLEGGSAQGNTSVGQQVMSAAGGGIPVPNIPGIGSWTGAMGTGSSVGGGFGPGDPASFLMGFSRTNAEGISGLNPDFAGRLAMMFQNAPPGIRDALTINSGFRSIGRQRELWNAALAKYGSPAAARKWVAPPGKSQHNFGMAADLGYGSTAAREWVHQNAGNYGLGFRMGNEPWHIEPMKGAQEALQPFTDGLEGATENLDVFGGGLGQLGNALGGMGGQGGGGLFSFIPKLFGFGGTPTSIGGLYAKGGIANSPSIFGEAGPEAAVPLPDGKRIPVKMEGPWGRAATGGDTVTISGGTIVVNGDPSERSMEQVKSMLAENNKKIKKMMDERDKNRWRTQ